MKKGEKRKKKKKKKGKVKWKGGERERERGNKSEHGSDVVGRRGWTDRTERQSFSASGAACVTLSDRRLGWLQRC